MLLGSLIALLCFVDACSTHHAGGSLEGGYLECAAKGWRVRCGADHECFQKLPIESFGPQKA